MVNFLCVLFDVQFVWEARLEDIVHFATMNKKLRLNKTGYIICKVNVVNGCKILMASSAFLTMIWDPSLL